MKRECQNCDHWAAIPTDKYRMGKCRGVTPSAGCEHPFPATYFDEVCPNFKEKVNADTSKTDPS